MAQTGKPAGGRVAKQKAAIIFLKNIPQKSKIAFFSPGTWRKPVLITAAVALTINILAIGTPFLIAKYTEEQSRIPRPLADQQQNDAPAADATNTNHKAEALPDDKKAQIAEQLKKERDGKARDPRHIQALSEDRNEHERVYLNADGTKSLVNSFQATSFKDSDGKWQDVDATLEQDQASGKWQSKANAWKVTFGNISEGVQITQNGNTFSLVPVDGKSVKPTVSGQAPKQIVTYKNVWQGVDLQYKVAGSELKESIIIKSKVAHSSFDFEAIGANLNPNSNRSGSFLLDGAFKGFAIAAATVFTSDESSNNSLPEVVQTVSGSRVHIDLSADWLAKQSVGAFPVIIDPSVYGPSAPADYYNFSSTGSSCHGSVACGGQAAGNISGTLNWRFAYQSNLTSIGAGNFPLSATLHLELLSGFTAASSISVDHSTCQTGFACYDTAWGTSTGSADVINDIDVTNVYMGAMWAGNTNPWFMVHGNETAGSNTYKLFDDTATDVTITYEALPTQSVLDTTKNNPADGGIAVTTQPTFFSTTSSDSDGPAPILYRFIIGTSKSVPSYNPYNIAPSVGGVVADSGQSASTQWTVPDNVLQDGTTYYWQVSAKDSLSGSPEVYSPAYSFKVDMRNGKDVTQPFDTIGPFSVDMSTGNLTTSAQTHAITALGGSIGVNIDYNSPQVSRRGLVGSYWNDSGSHTFPGTAAPLQRVDPNVDFNWGTGGPYTGIINQDGFLARWDGYFVAPENGTYQFGTTSDDGSRIYLDANYSTAYLDQWSTLPTNVFGTTRTLTAGQIVPIRFEYYENTGSAKAQLLVKDNVSITAQPINTSWLQTGVRPAATPHGLVGRYYTDDGSHNFPTQDDPARLFLTRLDSTLTQNWGTGSPVPNGPSTGFMVKWTGSYVPPVTGTYNFKSTVSDGVRVTIGGSTQAINSWSDHEPAATVGPTTPVSLTGGVPVSITVDYYQNTGTDQISLLVNRPDQGSVYAPIDTTALLPQAQVLPDGWGLGIDADGNLGYDYAYFGLNSVTLRDSTGQTHEYKFVNNGFVPPAGEDGHMVRNGDGTVTFQDSDGRTYVFGPDGTLKSSTMPVDDRKPAALQYIYGGSPAHLTQISDAATQSNPNDASTATRWAKILYAGDSNCPTVPAGYIPYANAVGMVCAVYTSDGTQSLPVNVSNNNVTRFLYITITHPDGSTAPFLSRIERPGGEYTDYGFDAIDGFPHSLGRIASMRDGLANDAIAAGVRSQDGTELTTVIYDALGHVTSVTLPAATAGATRLAHTYNYYQGSTAMHVTGATEPNGFTRKVLYDGTYRTTDDYDVANLITHTDWHANKDLILATTDPAQLKTTTLYDYDDRPTHQYGPAPADWFGADYKPKTTPIDYTPQVPHNETAYDGYINGLAAAYYDVNAFTNNTGISQPTKALFGAPKLHTTGIATGTGDVNKTWGSTPPFTLNPNPAGGTYGWGVRLSGFLHTATTGTYTFRIQSDDGVRLWVDDVLVIDDWADGSNRSHGMVSGYTGLANNGDQYHRIRLDYYNKAVSGVADTDATLALYMNSGGGETSAIGNLLNPGYSLKTSETVYDSHASVGNTTTVTNYGTNPELGLAQTVTVDSGGANLVTTNTYEAQGVAGGFLRQLTKSLPGAPAGNPTNARTFYAGTDTRQNPCNASQTFKQPGMVKLTTSASPANNGTGNRVKELVYDDAGRVIASRFNTETDWTCLTYDARGRLSQKVNPANSNGSGSTSTYIYSVSGNPLISSVSDSTTNKVVTTIDLLGRTVSYQDRNNTSVTPTTTTYDNFGRVVSRSGKLGTEAYVFDNNNRLTSQKLNNTIVATPTYDTAGRLQQVTYPQAGQQKQVIGRDSLGRVNSYDYTLGNGTTHDIDTVTLSQSGQVVSGTELGVAKAYTYDKVGRLTNATIGANTYAYSYAAPNPATCNQASANLNAHKNTNRTSQTINGATTTYCYDSGDRLIASSDASLTTPTFDTHGNIGHIGAAANANYLQFGYDARDRTSYIQDVYGTNHVAQYHYDPQDRLYERDESQGTTTLWDSWYGYTSPDSTGPDYEMDASWNVRERYVKLVGGVLFTVRNTTLTSTTNVYSLFNVHGDTMATTNGAGAQTNTYTYEPFGKITSANKPDNANGKGDFDSLGRYQKQTETWFGNQPQVMGARIYLPTLGSFTQVDPIEGGCANAYAYTYGDPVNTSDISGTKTDCGRLAKAIKAVRNELVKRYVDIRTDKLRLPWIGKNSIQGHKMQFQQKQTNLRGKLTEWDNNDCNNTPGGPRIPGDAWKWATRDAPNPIQWRTVGKYALYGVAAVGIGAAIFFAPEVSLPVLGAGGAASFAH